MKECKCPNTHCHNHSQCEKCQANHAGKDYPPHCEREQ